MATLIFIDGAGSDPKLQQLENDLNDAIQKIEADYEKKIAALEARVRALEAV